MWLLSIIVDENKQHMNCLANFIVHKVVNINKFRGDLLRASTSFAVVEPPQVVSVELLRAVELSLKEAVIKKVTQGWKCKQFEGKKFLLCFLC